MIENTDYLFETLKNASHYDLVSVVRRAPVGRKLAASPQGAHPRGVRARGSFDGPGRTQAHLSLISCEFARAIKISMGTVKATSRTR
jgi:hypothetical protein